MRASLNEIRQLEDYISSSLGPDDNLLLSARLVLDPRLRLNLTLQKKVYRLVYLYGRKKLQSEIESAHRRLFDDPGKKDFQQSILDLFN